MSTATNDPPWRSYLFLGVDTHGEYTFAFPLLNVPGVPDRGRAITYGPDHPASRYWAIRSKWAAYGPDEFDAFYDKWMPKRDKALDPDEPPYLGKSYAEWQLFYMALADERQARQHAYGQLGPLGGKELVRAMSQGGRSG